ncbi:hypothetical protein ACFFYR_02035 [Paraburkholderia dipogonis]|uniref:hypothetical protein n=1 Tax=Paraburkholderia dipogonis TaxID=1211383 RepID=UPI0035EA6626
MSVNVTPNHGANTIVAHVRRLEEGVVSHVPSVTSDRERAADIGECDRGDLFIQYGEQ